VSVLYKLAGITKQALPPKVASLCEEAFSIKDLKRLLKKHKLQRHEAAACDCYEALNGQCRSVSRETLRRMVRIFVGIERAWETLRKRICPTRKSMLSYVFVAQKICAYIGETELMKTCSGIKCRSVRNRLEAYWQQLLPLLNWSPAPSRSQIRVYTPDEQFFNANKGCIRSLQLHKFSAAKRARVAETPESR